ncbi:Chromosome (plasmid) partitioning protein ParB [Candidatus Burkholderia verschuerenii]|uniref:Chromosome (Plasmid) partitioning protein ParB n=1 Tax=Candidatus Burkholderia verschuerenii TaxID=242163 RepID=A0A0L0MFM5_9BURK|nr:ParB/RepB/Spo0J family partition protein [Candidatus Burkholderia verschuerenii]KND61507.1 Chromosome (plasmid) partitioning protein ParB [Candidatus Burkholderia verschuerenii]
MTAKTIKTPAKAKPAPAKADAKTAAPKPRATFAAASFGNLRAASGEGHGEALCLMLADIIEDHDQPRRVFDQAELESMAETIKLKGVIQPIVVRPSVEGRYMLAFGARRFRASKIAGVKDIPAVIRVKDDDDFAAQVIENQQRANLTNSDLSAAIDKLSSEGKNNKQIAAICNLKDYQVAAFKQAASFPPELRARMDNSDMRALYDLFRQWGKTPVEVIEALPDADTFITITEARRIIGSITGKPTGSIVLDRHAAPALVPPPHQAPFAEQSKPQPGEAKVAERPGFDFSRPNLSPDAALAPKPERSAEPHAAAPVFIVRIDGAEQGALILDRKAKTEGCALVRFPTGIEEISVSELRIVRIE